MEIIPAIDLIDGRCVRLTRGDFSTSRIYNSDPLEVAQRFEAAGIRRLHLVDLDGARLGKMVHVHVLKTIARETNLAIDYGGGITTCDEVARVLDEGAAFVTIGSMAVKNRMEFLVWIRKFGASKIILCADVLSGKIVFNGWQKRSETVIDDFLQEFSAQGISQVICTDVSKDGLLQGPSFDLYERILKLMPHLHLIASGGVRDKRDLERLKRSGLHGVIVGKALYEGRISLEELQKFALSC